MKILSLTLLSVTLLLSCNNKSTDTIPEEGKIEDVPVKQIPDENAIADAKLDEENLDDEKTKVSFITSNSNKDGFEEAIKGLKRIENKTINETMIFELYKQGGNQDCIECDFKAVIRIGDYYLPIRLGDDHSIKIQDLVYNDNMQEIIINKGRFSYETGEWEEIMVVRTFKKRPFTLTDFGTIYIDYFAPDDRSYLSAFKEKLGAGYKEKLLAVLDSKEIIIIKGIYENENSKLVIQSYKPYKTGFAKGSFTKKITAELAG